MHPFFLLNSLFSPSVLIKWRPTRTVNLNNSKNSILSVVAPVLIYSIQWIFIANELKIMQWHSSDFGIFSGISRRFSSRFPNYVKDVEYSFFVYARGKFLKIVRPEN